MIRYKATYILLLMLLLFTQGCHITKNVPEGRYWIKENVIEVSGDDLDIEEIEEIIKQPENFRTLGFRLKLRAYNMVDSAAVTEKRIRKNEKLDRINLKRQAREGRINKRRIDRAVAKNDSLYSQKIIPLKDTLNPRLFLTEWLKYKYGEPPVVLDTTLFHKSNDQLAKYLKKKGYYTGSNSGEIIYKKNKTAIVKYKLITGERYFIDSVYGTRPNYEIQQNYQAYQNLGMIEPLKGEPFDRDLLDDYRTRLSKIYRDAGYYGFTPNHITFLADTSAGNRKVTLGIQFSDRVKLSENLQDTLAIKPFNESYIRKVYFHFSDTSFLDETYNQRLNELGLERLQGKFFQTIDTFVYNERISEKTGLLDPRRKATFLFNGEMFVNPELIECQNYLEETNIYKEYYLERTYTRLIQLGLFQVIKPEIIEIEGTDSIDVHYYLSPADKQSFGFEPRLTNSNGFLGISASTNYINKNLLRGGQRITFSFTGGIESQPPVFDPNASDKLLENNSTSFNTFDIGPSFQLEIPGLFPTSVTALSKRHRPKTIVSGAYNYQRRPEYTRHTFQANYMWKMFVGKIQIYQYGLPMLAVLKYVNIQKEDYFNNLINQFNDLFLRNVYSDQLVWQDWKFLYELNNRDLANKKSKLFVYYNCSFDPAGNFISLFRSIQDTNEVGRYQIFGVPYSRFVRLDNDLNLSLQLNKKSSVHSRLMAGAGIITGNKETSLPFDYSFFAGGSNDNRGWRARSLGPGNYKYWLDTNRTLTQIGDVRLAGSIEYRRVLGNTLRFATFLDAGNIWTMKNDENRPGSQISTDWYKQIALSGGIGFRFDLDFFVVRLDLGIPLNNPTLPKGSTWIWNSRTGYNNALLEHFGEFDLARLRSENLIPRPFVPQVHFGIGYPF